MTRELTIAEAVRELRERFALDVDRKAVQRRCVGGKVNCRKTIEGWYLIPEEELQALHESFPRKGS